MRSLAGFVHGPIPFAELPPFGAVLRQALALDEEVFAEVQRAPTGLWVALAVVFLSGLSEALGQSLVLFLNRVTPQRFVLALLLAAGSHVVGYVVWTTSIWIVGTYVLGGRQPFPAVAAAVGLAYAPQLFSFFVLVPYAGSFWGLVLSIWSLLATVVAIQVGLELTIWQAVACSGLGWLLVQAWRRTLGRPVLAVWNWFQRRAIGLSSSTALEMAPRLRPTYRLRRWLRQEQGNDDASHPPLG